MGAYCFFCMFFKFGCLRKRLCVYFRITIMDFQFLTDLKSCFLCEGAADMKLEPCGHVTMCHQCVQSTRIAKCPQSACRVRVTLLFQDFDFCFINDVFTNDIMYDNIVGGCH